MPGLWNPEGKTTAALVPRTKQRRVVSAVCKIVMRYLRMPGSCSIQMTRTAMQQIGMPKYRLSFLHQTDLRRQIVFLNSTLR